MVEFEFQPWKRIILHEVAKFSVEYFVSSHSLGVQQGGVGRPITWAMRARAYDDIIGDDD